MLHVAYPGIYYTDRGKSAAAGALMQEQTIAEAVENVTKAWAKQRRQEDRQARAYLNRRSALARQQTVSIRQAAWEIIM